MKKFIAVLAFIVLLAPVPVALPRGGNFTYILNQKWKRVEAFQKRQDEKFIRLEREADRAIVPTDPDRNIHPNQHF